MDDLAQWFRRKFGKKAQSTSAAPANAAADANADSVARHV